MMTLQEFITDIEHQFGQTVERQYEHPFLRMTIRSPNFENVSIENRESILCETLGTEQSELRELINRGFLRLDLLAPDEAGSNSIEHGTSWLSLLESAKGESHPSEQSGDAASRYVHFYGFKGGQARTTALVALAHSLARDGWRVLTVDFDAEAPSLDLMLNGATSDVSKTVLGLRVGEEVRPMALGRTVRGGEVFVLPFRPRGSAYDLDAVALAFEFQVYSPTAITMAQKLDKLSNGYDVVLIDHRTGLGAIVPTLVKNLPGPVVVCARLDRQSDHAVSTIAALWATLPESTGLLLSLASPEESEDRFRKKNSAEASSLLQALATASGEGDEGEPREWAEFLDHWIVWPFDRGVATRGFTSGGVASDSVFAPAISEMRRLLELQEQRARQHKQSGAKDEGDLIVTQALRQLRSPDSPVILIVGRKGTGKTRLVRQLAEEGLGEPLLVPSDFTLSFGGIKAGDLGLRELAKKHKGKEEDFWYALVCGALESSNTKEPALLQRVQEASTDPALLDRLRKIARTVKGRRTFLVDALESAFDHEQTFPFVQGLFRVLESIDATPDINERVQLRLFVRRDLLERGIQNREQFEDGRRLDLSWDVQTILNFVLTRIAAIQWYAKIAPDLVQQINDRLVDLREGQLATKDCELLLLKLFPQSIQYKNIKTTTFLRTYFSDEGREPSFYPRVYLVFLEQIANQHKKVNLRASRLDGTVIVKAHEFASTGFLQEVSQELAHALGFSQTIISGVLDGLKGKTTPFAPDSLAKMISGSDKSLASGDVRRVFDVMKQLGMFEDHPKRLNTWRAGRLFKTGLRMRFASGN
jgi:Mrp family chromosome partitioning ATPase